jgi:hypothetical protein
MTMYPRVARHALLIGAALLSGCAATPAPRTRSSPTALPAGIYFRHHIYSTCPGCPTPGAVVLLGVYPDIASARRALAQISTAVPPGYPLVVHTDELGIVPSELPAEGIALVGGLFESMDHAREFFAHQSSARVVPLMSADKAFADLRRKHGDARRNRFIARIGAGPPVPAYDRSGIDPQGEEVPVIGQESPELEELCRIPPGSIFLVRHEDVLHHREWVPVDCEGKPAYVRWTDTLVEASIVPRLDGTLCLIQVMSVSCDVPELGYYRYDAQGRQSPSGATRVGPCPGLPRAGRGAQPAR